MVKVPAYQVQKFLQKPTVNAFLIYGPDQGQVLERCKRLAQQVSPNLQDAFNVSRFSGSELAQEPEKLALEMQSQSLLGGQRVIWVQDISDSLFTHLEPLFESKNNFFHRLIIQAGDLTPKSKIRKLFETQKLGAAIPCYHDESQSIGQIIQSLLLKNNLKINRDALQYLETHLGEDHLITKKEIEKLILYVHGKSTVELSDAIQCVGDHSLISLDLMVNDIADGKMHDFLNCYSRLVGEGISEVMITRTCLRHFQRLLEVKGHIKSGQPLEASLTKLRPPIFFKNKQKFIKQLTLWTEDRILLALDILYKTEAYCKQTHMPASLTCQHNLLLIAKLAYSSSLKRTKIA